MKREGRACRVRSLQWHRSPFRGRRVGARCTRAASARGGGAKIREGSFSTFGNQSRRDAENAEEPRAPSRGKPVDVPGANRPSARRRRAGRSWWRRRGRGDASHLRLAGTTSSQPIYPHIILPVGKCATAKGAKPLISSVRTEAPPLHSRTSRSYQTNHISHRSF